MEYLAITTLLKILKLKTKYDIDPDQLKVHKTVLNGKNEDGTETLLGFEIKKEVYLIPNRLYCIDKCPKVCILLDSIHTTTICK